MTYQPKSIEEHIDCLARLTDAPGYFVEQVRALFTSKGISLDTDANHITKLRDNFRKVGEAYVDQISQLRRLQSSLKEESRRLRTKVAPQRTTPTRVTISGDHRSLVTKTVREQLPMVPGPKEPQ
jgi:hypothetical protein